MIRRITGKVLERRESSLIMDVGGLGYEVLVSDAVLESMDDHVREDGTMTLETFHYVQTDPSRSVPMLIGFLSALEREFFERFITVSGVGPRGALKAFRVPAATIAQAIDNGDVTLLRSLPGIGDRRAREIIAKLQGKVTAFAAQAPASSTPGVPSGATAQMKDQVIDVLLQLQYRKPEAERMVRGAMQRRPDAATVEELLSEVYRQAGDQDGDQDVGQDVDHDGDLTGDQGREPAGSASREASVSVSREPSGSSTRTPAKGAVRTSRRGASRTGGVS